MAQQGEGGWRIDGVVDCAVRNGIVGWPGVVWMRYLQKRGRLDDRRTWMKGSGGWRSCMKGELGGAVR